MKYRLIKDLPFLKAGAVFSEREINGVPHFTCPSTVHAEYRYTVADMEDLKDFFEPIEEHQSLEELEWDDSKGQAQQLKEKVNQIINYLKERDDD